MGRFNGEEKLFMERRGWNINSNKALQALKVKWQELDLEQVAAGVKSVVTECAENYSVAKEVTTAEEVANSPTDVVTV